MNNKLYLSEIIEIEKSKFESNNLILSPSGSGKTHFILNQSIKNLEKNLILVSNSLSRKHLENKLEKEFKDKFEILTYLEFEEKIFVNDNYVKEVKNIFCDEIHSLPEYAKRTNIGLAHAQKYLFNPQEGKQIFYFTAINQNLLEMERKHPDTLNCVKIFDYRKHKNIKRYAPLAIEEITHLEQIRQHLLNVNLIFEHQDYKGMAFGRTISSLKEIERIVIEEGYTPLILWSDKNEDNKLTNEQIMARNELLSTGKIPKPYNFLIFNSALQEGWELKDDSVKIAIINTMNETEFIQSLGRLRKDVDLLVCKSDKKPVKLIEIPERYLNVHLTSSMKRELCERLNVLNDKGKPLQWPGIKKRLLENDCHIRETQIRINKKPTKVSIITPKTS